MANLLGKLCGTKPATTSTTSNMNAPLPDVTLPSHPELNESFSSSSSSSSSSISSMSSSTLPPATATMGQSQLPTTTTTSSNVEVAPPIQLPTQVLPAIHKTQVLPTEVHRVEQHSTTNVIQPIHREVVQPVETVVKRPVVEEIQPIHHTVVQPKVETTIRPAPSAVVAPTHETTRLETVRKQVEKDSIVLPPKEGAPLPTPPTVIKETEYRQGNTTFDKGQGTGIGTMSHTHDGTHPHIAPLPPASSSFDQSFMNKDKSSSYSDKDKAKAFEKGFDKGFDRGLADKNSSGGNTYNKTGTGPV